MDLDIIWKSALADLELSLTKATYQTHFAKTRLISFEKGVATIGVENKLMRDLIEGRYYALVKKALDESTKQDVSVVFTVVARKEILKQSDAGPLFNQMAPPARQDSSSVARRLHIRPESTFDTFAVSSSNQIAYAAATAVAKSPGTAYNPLFLYGGVGVGKTHLMHAVANAVLAKKSSVRTIYCMGEEFLNEIVEAIQTKTARQFKQKYRSAELLMVDDVQFIAGKQTAQEEFFHTFNAVHREGGQIILTSDRAPAEISRLEDRLRSRFEGGLIVDISPPDFELRAAIVNIKSLALGLTIPPDAAQLIASNTSDTRAIEGFLRRLTTELATGKTEVTAELVSQILKAKNGGEGIRTATTKRVAPQDVLEATATYFGIKSTALKGPKRDRPIARPRQVVMYLCKNQLGLTLDDIGGLLGGRDHTTVMHGVDTITHELSTNNHLRLAVEGIKQKLWA